MPFTTEGLNNLLGTANAAGAAHAAVFNGDPSGAGSQIGARVSIAFGTAAGGERALTTQPEFAVPGGQTVTHIGYFTAATGGTLVYYHDVTDEAFGEDGTYRLTSGTLKVTNA
jgi:hypothetical protein